MTNSAYAKNDVDRLLCSILCRGCVRLDRGGLPKCFQMYKNFSGHIIIFFCVANIWIWGGGVFFSVLLIYGFGGVSTPCQFP